MEIFKDGKYIIGFLVGVICSFIVMGGVENYKNSEGEKLSGTNIEVADEGQLSVSGKETQINAEEGNASVDITKKENITKPEDPHSPELQRLALILRETGKMVERLKKEMAALQNNQQTAGILNQN